MGLSQIDYAAGGGCVGFLRPLFEHLSLESTVHPSQNILGISDTGGFIWTTEN
jgi:hypothetical protein